MLFLFQQPARTRGPSHRPEVCRCSRTAKTQDPGASIRRWQCGPQFKSISATNKATMPQNPNANTSSSSVLRELGPRNLRGSWPTTIRKAVTRLIVFPDYLLVLLPGWWPCRRHKSSALKLTRRTGHALCRSLRLLNAHASEERSACPYMGNKRCYGELVACPATKCLRPQPPSSATLAPGIALQKKRQ